MSTEEEIADLKRQLAEVKDAMRAKPEPEPIDWEKEIAKHNDRVHQMREGRANSWMPPSAVQEMAGHPCNQVMGGVVRDRHAPNNPSMSQASGGGSGKPAERGTGWVDPTPLGPPPGIQHVDAQLIADEVRQRAELKRKLGEG
jgi:hypothetical protein